MLRRGCWAKLRQKLILNHLRKAGYNAKLDICLLYEVIVENLMDRNVIEVMGNERCTVR